MIINLDALHTALVPLAKASSSPPAALAVLEEAGDLIKTALKSVKAANGLTMELAGELKALGEKLVGLATPPAPDSEPPPGTEMDKSKEQPVTAQKSMTPVEFVAFAKAQLVRASKASPADQTNIFAGLLRATAIAKESFANAGGTVPVPAIEDAFRGAGGGSPMDLTSSAEQATTEVPLGQAQQGGTGQYAVNPGEVQTQNPGVAGATGLDTTTQGGASQFAVNPEVAKASAALDALAKDLAGSTFEWPTDLARKPEDVQKGASPHDWGADPWR